jgi:4-amino-4-deoxy-L-arabinose transferase-like glycosyltransferase
MSSQSRVTPDRAVLAGLFVTAAIYCRDLQYDFLLDDVQLILMNQTTASWHNLKMIFTTDAFFAQGPRVPIAETALHYRPVFMLWLMINQQLFGSILPWWHLTSLLLHLAVTFLVYKLGVKMLKEPWPAALAALFFAVHPIHAESVSYVSASTDLLVALFSIAAFLWYARFREEGASPAYLAGAVFAAALAMLSKETAAMFPWLLVAYEALRDVAPASRRNWRHWAWTLPFFGVVAAYAVVRTLLFGHNVGPGPGGGRLAAIADIPLVLLVYLRNLSWPVHLSFLYPVEWSTEWTLLKGAALILFLAVTGWLWIRYRDRPNLRLLLLWTVILFVPPLLGVTAFVKEGWVGDRHMYLVSAPLFLVLAALLMEAKLPRKSLVAVGAVILVVLSVETAVQLPRFSDGISIYESALQVAPRNSLAHFYLAFALCGYGRYEEAFREFRITEELRPQDPVAYGSYAEALSQVSRNEEAAAEYEKALRWASSPTPYRAFLLYRLASIKVKESDAVAGEGYLREAIRIAPDAPSYHAILADALRRQGRTQEADQQMLVEASVQKSLIRSGSQK